MKKRTQGILFIAVLAFLSFARVDGNLTAQERQSPNVDEQADNPAINIPFIDRDGDGINDLLQNGWGLRFVNRYKKRRALWEQLNAAVVMKDDGQLVDTDGDGKGDISFRDHLMKKMEESIDTDGDGKADTPLREHLRKRFQSFDDDGDGLPDELTPEDIRRYKQEMSEWQKQIRDRIFRGLPPFIDKNDDGVPDDLPAGFGRRGPGKERR